MQYDDAKRLREDWGDKPCDHPNFEKEYYLGAHTMDYVCSTCGRDFTGQERDEILAKRNKKKNNSTQ